MTMADVHQRPTRRQLETLCAYLDAGSIKAAASQLGITETTARQNLSALYRRTGSLNAAQAAFLLGRGAFGTVRGDANQYLCALSPGRIGVRVPLGCHFLQRRKMVKVSLPDPVKAPLGKSPLQLVVCQVRFEETLAVSDAKLVLQLHGDLGGRAGPYPKLESVRGTRVEIPMAAGGPLGAPSETAFAGWRMSSADGWIVTIMPDSVALETSRYTTWDEDFGPRFRKLIEAVASRISPSIEQRLGLRYVDRITQPKVTSPDQWKDFVSEPFLGPIMHPTVGRLVKNSQQQTLLTLDDGISALVRTGFAVEDDASSDLAYLLDFDVSRSEVRAFDVQSILQGAETLHDLNIRLFQQAVTPRLLEALA